MSIAYIGIGSNLSEPIMQVRQAIEELDDLSQSMRQCYSSLYRSPPMVVKKRVVENGIVGEGSLEEKQDQPDYVNAVAELNTGLSPLDLLHELQHLEALHNRIRAERWGPRTLDLDVLLYDDRIIESPELTVPHPGLYERNFVLYPLAEIAPDLEIPGAGQLGELLGSCELGNLEKLTH
jgi:2-amino-4-hydroxy-6-hydroxymethyldihydropteridine diphosphokinase